MDTNKIDHNCRKECREVSDEGCGKGGRKCREIREGPRKIHDRPPRQTKTVVSTIFKANQERKIQNVRGNETGYSQKKRMRKTTKTVIKKAEKMAKMGVTSESMAATRSNVADYLLVVCALYTVLVCVPQLAP